jgi:hypothetical protein
MFHPTQRMTPTSASQHSEFRSHQPERRRTARGAPGGEPHRVQLVALVLGTYREMPGMQLNIVQAARMFGLRETTCLIVFEDLVRQQQLRRSGEGYYATR